jgi:hypothetical protein
MSENIKIGEEVYAWILDRFGNPVIEKGFLRKIEQVEKGNTWFTITDQVFNHIITAEELHICSTFEEARTGVVKYLQEKVTRCLNIQERE